MNGMINIELAQIREQEHMRERLRRAAGRAALDSSGARTADVGHRGGRRRLMARLMHRRQPGTQGAGQLSCETQR